MLSSGKMTITMKAYLIHVRIKKHRNSLAKLRLSDHQLHIQTGRQTRPKTPQNLRICKNCPQFVENEADFLFQSKKMAILKLT